MVKSRVELGGDLAEPVYARLKEIFGGQYGDYVVLRRRMHDLVGDFGDADMVVAVVLEIVEVEGARFSPILSLAFAHFAYVREKLGWPDGSWRYARWLAEGAGDERTASSVDHWLSRWRGAYEEGDLDAQLECSRALEGLWAERGAGM
jgi:hypothetical protein